jgi:hypothetical protein
MSGRIMMLAALVCFVAMSVDSCSHECITIPGATERDDSPGRTIEYGRLHNEILQEYANRTHMFRDRIPRANAVKLFILCSNIVFERNGLEFTVDDHFVDSTLAVFAHIGEQCGFDFFEPGSNPEAAFTYLERTGRFDTSSIERLRKFWKGIVDPERAIEFHEPAPPGGPDPMFPVIDITEHSAEYWREYYYQMEEYVAQHPELQGWWDKWKKRVREWAMIGSDCIGGLAGLGAGPAGAIAGAALGSIAFTFAWPPY